MAEWHVFTVNSLAEHAHIDLFWYEANWSEIFAEYSNQLKGIKIDPWKAVLQKQLKRSWHKKWSILRWL